MLLSTGHRSVGADQVEPALWIRPAVAVAALLLFWHAPALSRSLLFHYASGVTLAMVLGVALLVYFVVRRVSPSRGGTGTLYAAVRQLGWRLVAEHWPALLAYLGFFGLLGYATTFWRLKGGRPEEYQSALLAQAL